VSQLFSSVRCERFRWQSCVSRKCHVFANARHTYGIREMRPCNHTVTGQASTRKISNDRITLWDDGQDDQTHVYVCGTCAYVCEEQERWMNLVPGRLRCTKGKVTWYTSRVLICKARVRPWYVSGAGLKILWRRDIKNRALAWKLTIENCADFNSEFFIL